ncbi:MAG: hypothetical protein ABIJ44_07765 [Pseudomonadota bacterium]
MKKQTYDLEERLLEYSVRIIKIVEQLPNTMFQTRLPRLSCTERAYPKRSAMAGRFVGMWK